MHPAEHEAALSGFFRRHDIPIYAAPPAASPVAPSAPMERMGCALYGAERLIADGFRIAGIGGSGRYAVGAIQFGPEDQHLALVTGAYLGHTLEAIAEGSAPEHNGAPVDRMAVLMLRAEADGIEPSADHLAGFGIPGRLIAEFAHEAAHLATAMKLARRAYLDLRTRRAVAAELEHSEAA